MIFIPLPKTATSPLPPPSRSPLADSSSSTSGAGDGITRRRSRRPSSKAQQSSSVSPSASSRASTSVSREGSAAANATASSVNTSARSTPEISVPPSAVASAAVQRDLARVWEAVSDSRRIVVVCGAGISVSQPAGIPDFRSSTGLFKSLKEQHPEAGLTSGKDLFDARLFQSEANTALFYSMIASLHKMTVSAQPTLFHHFLRCLDEQGRLQRVYTQNIDALEERAGLTFGLGEGAGRLFKKTASLGKRKRAAGTGVAVKVEAEDQTLPAGRRRATWSKSQSAPSVSLAPSPSLFGPSPEPTTAMFPRVIPLHGSLANLVCTACDHKMATLPTPSEAVATAIQSLADGEPPECPACSERDAVRLAAGLRSRGIGFLKPDVVLYNGDNKSGERVGECLERDVLGLRDPLDGKVPETTNERLVRKRRAEKEAEKERSFAITEEEEVSQSMLSVGGLLGGGGDDVLGKVFEEDEQDEEEEEGKMADSLADCHVSGPKPRPRKGIQRAVTQPTPTAMIKQASTTSSDGGASTAGGTPTSRNGKAKLKPLPPDLLIVAGTSLKVPGTKRVVREFAKAARARDGIVPKGCKSRHNASANDNREGSNTPSSRSRSRSRISPGEVDSDSDADSDSDEEGAREDGSNPHRPIRTVLLNYDFPVPSKEWEGIFDVWIQGDVQASAGGLWKAAQGFGRGRPVGAGDDSEEEDAKDAAAGEEAESIEGCEGWHVGMDQLDEAREVAKKNGKLARVSKQAFTAGEDKDFLSPPLRTSSAKSTRRVSSTATNGLSASAGGRRSPAAGTSATSRLKALKEENASSAAAAGFGEGEDVDMTETSMDYSDGSSPVIKVTPAASPQKGRVGPKSPQKPKVAKVTKAASGTSTLKRTPSLKSAAARKTLAANGSDGSAIAAATATTLASDVAPSTSKGKAESNKSANQGQVDKSFTAVKRRNSMPNTSTSTSIAGTTAGKTKAGAGKEGSAAGAGGAGGSKVARKPSVGRPRKSVGG
ncbi:DHS-like NAD/FAD-binding domain-containing protein [Microstroma glucosiphilum]|uniref:DHS-like NAD/FAD-binding domain-containing protein n=1 Tax=Pseudomicrostroma glucosiphilum TaxID=1684307 RepID=A0A316UCM9_9BASI|nr:DHS-like NAD/FAD-binding domain-containing protein [Pseudomicrostroma glucosiphilum]PWN22171.1 DHS-like NAD/FAD-binding domain-containing protein [Pseudomicrostroma glucosiphilum]